MLIALSYESSGGEWRVDLVLSPDGVAPVDLAPTLQQRRALLLVPRRYRDATVDAATAPGLQARFYTAMTPRRSTQHREDAGRE